MRAALYTRVLLATLCCLLALATSGAPAGQGWYLLGPPGDIPNALGGPSWPEMRAELLRIVPLSRWAQYQVFDTAPACEEELDRLHNNAMANFSATVPGEPAWLRAKDNLTRRALMICVASDDPRLRP